MKNKLRSLLANKYFLHTAIYLSFFVLHLVLSSSTCTPLIHSDEAGYIRNARAFAESDVQSLTTFSSFNRRVTYYPGYSLLLTPVFWQPGGLPRDYRWIQIINAFLLAWVPILAYHFARIFAGKLAESWLWFIAIAVSLYPPYMLYGNLALSESLFIPLFLYLVLNFIRLTQNSHSLLAWLSVLLVYAFVVVTHPRAFALLPAVLFTMIWVVTNDLPDRHKKLFLYSSTLAALLVLTCVLLLLATNQKVYHTNPARYLLYFTDWEQWKNLATSFIAKSTYTFLTSYGLVLLGTVYGFHLLWKHSPDVEQKQRPVVMFVVMSLLLIVFLSALQTYVSRNRLDYIIYGRHSDSVMLPLMVLGLAAIAQKRLCIARWFVVAGVLVFSGLTHLFYGDLLARLPNNPINIMGLGFYHFSHSFNWIFVALFACGACIVGLLLAHVHRLLALAFWAFLFAYATLQINDGYFARGSAARLKLSEFTSILQEYQETNGHETLFYDRRGSMWIFYNYQTYLPKLNIKHKINGNLFVSDRFRLPKEIVGARMVSAYPGHYAWVLPGPCQDWFSKKGYIFPENFPCPLPASACNAQISASFTQLQLGVSERITVPVRISHRGEGYAWSGEYDAQQKKYTVSLHVCTLDLNTGQLADCQILPLPKTVYPRHSVDWPLSIRTYAKGKKFTPGNYLLRLDLMQQGVQWFCQHHPDAGCTLLLKITDAGIEVEPYKDNAPIPAILQKHPGAD